MKPRALITGAASGIGLAVARELHGAGWAVAGLDIQPMPDATIFAQWLSCDLASADGVSTIAKQIADQKDIFDAAVFCAGVAGIGDPARVLQINFFSVRAMLQKIGPAIADNGSITLLSSGAGWRWMDRKEAILAIHDEANDDKAMPSALDSCAEASEAYVRSKELLTSLAARSCLDHWPRGVRINAVSPGSVATPLIEDFTQSMGPDAMDFSRHTVGRDASVEEIAQVIAFLVSPAARWINGADIRTDGGLTGALASGIAKYDGWS